MTAHDSARPRRSTSLRRAYLRDYRYAYGSRFVHLREGWDVSRYASGDGAPVLLIPGIYETWQFLRPIAERLHSAGHPIHVLPALGYNTRPITASAGVGQDYLREHDLRGVVVVAHSKGGLIGKHMMVVDDREEGRIERMIAVSTPFNGSSLARIAPARALREFAPHRPLIRRLLAEREADARITSIYGMRDQYIPRGSRLAGAHENIAVSVVGHFALLSHPRVLDLIAARA
ncbi:esterase/lipase family protein [Rathayibacter rathayi]|uniref:Alpha/beta hydrolase n=1 Tax=Rathayibacter rathayi TaxID=33887 RepID=A0ABD6W8Z0_RATRA|nr:alpha/beta hydrolase [Rathayibacter rathayi]PPF14174.1 alpha/beta hydrolase [Rathayibacter rathayi]PPF24046.1 alpha/beta hydrolase [Rathayibacter rathayi]PPF80056.1 alpha/beta hydrolase [Rathayibacter rathayi]PPG13313.1 alpha/beta hydrolase [Rathayibacter rathayi]PPG43080.1 alpha/beta hydrolase [Rathayibacter rathayi]